MPFTPAILIPMGISIILSKIKPKYACLAYVISLIYIIDWLLQEAGLTQETLLPYDKLIFLTGILHATEGFLTGQYGSRDFKEITYNKKKIAGGYHLYRKWYVPLLFFSIEGVYIPIFTLVTYSDETYTMPPKEKSRKMGLVIKLYGCILLVLAFLIHLDYCEVDIGILFMFLLHELMFAINEQFEKNGSMNKVPEQGIRIIETSQNPNFHNPFSRGDSIEKINEVPINTIEDYRKVIENGEDRYIVVLRTLEGDKKTISCNRKLLKRIDNVFLF